ncbi:hypothetical protein TTHERM_001305847 (macronuclear) [Tetrahymena thermophila SB210]|uniref:Uncharacterized protein n=1 Tax=Tetrahymena thermophila (strain SB210) TaxID=312017 RepID=W7XFP2_TETTS|nr:hypothetical protein TTHERM_001305847 [Tetrahymena thermophila SB210]EWS71629.1 hypothetical protein TTHERM_001305847 [Tetrahymena thermophila SB210]|eukprot:XP_012655831.1 hypothetical protein TTHERM_001305847 [Tetrahymena thermophila SB210]
MLIIRILIYLFQLDFKYLILLINFLTKNQINLISKNLFQKKKQIFKRMKSELYKDMQKLIDFQLKIQVIKRQCAFFKFIKAFQFFVVQSLKYRFSQSVDIYFIFNASPLDLSKYLLYIS